MTGSGAANYQPRTANPTDSPRPGVGTTRFGGHKGSVGDLSMLLSNNANTVGRALVPLEARTSSAVPMS